MSLKIVGTSHIRPIVAKESYDFIALELDKYRFMALTHKAKRQFSWADAKQVGMSGYLFAYFGSIIQQYLAKKIGVVPGEDMLSAIKIAHKTGARIVLIDRPIQLTLARFSKTVKFWEKAKFISFLVASPLFAGQKMDLKKVPEKDVVEKLTAELKDKFPGLYRVLLSERDVYMSKKLLILQKSYPDAKILAVVGMGHLAGMEKRLANYIN